MDHIETINISRVSQYGDHFLCHAHCPKCKAISFFKYGEKVCCEGDQEKYGFSFNKSCFRLVVGTFRKHRIGKRLVQTIYSDQEGKCAYCFKDLQTEYHVEHIIPLCVGGSNARTNLCLSCPRCNLIAGAKFFNSYEVKRDYILGRRKVIG